MGIDIAAVADVVAQRFHPVGDRQFPAEPFARSRCERSIEYLTVLPIRPVVTDIDSCAPIPDRFLIVIKGVLAGPAIVGMPGVVRALKQEVDFSIIFNDERNVTLHPGF